jgi:hypothetical protein
VFYGQHRVGREGRPFKSWKFRSMVPDSDQHFGPLQARSGDARVTRVGRVLRCTGIIGVKAFQDFPLPLEPIVGSLGRMKLMARYGAQLPYTPPQPIAHIVDKGAFNLAWQPRPRRMVPSSTPPFASMTSLSMARGYI